MADDQSPSSSRPRRSSFAGDTFANLFGTKRSNSINRGSNQDVHSATTAQPTQQSPGPITSAAAQAQRRRLSLTTLGLSGSPGQAPSFNSYYRRESAGSAQSGSIDESAIEDDVAATPQNTAFGRRLSFGAKALRDVRNSSSVGTSGGVGGGTTEQNEGFNWSDNLRTRAERTSIAAGNLPNPPSASAHTRAKSVAAMEAPIKEMPVKAKEQVRPDHFQERILKGDFYMD